jgi:hypothetical protein
MGVLLDELGNPLLSQDGSQLLDEAAALALPGSLYPITVKAELLINGTWTDISHYVYQRDNIVITGGQQDETSAIQPASLTMTVNNRDGRFSPNYAGGAYYPYLNRNVQLRISATATSTTGNYYSGYRFWGEVSVWPPLSDITGADIYVQLTAAGPLRRVNQGGGQGSALTRYYGLLTGAAAPIAYWPCEEDPATNIIGAGIDGGTNMTITTGTPTWKAISSFNGSAPIGVINNSTWDGLTGSFGSSGDDVFTVAGTYQWVASTTSVDAIAVAGGGGGGYNKRTGGGAGEYAEEATLAVTPGTVYNLVVGAGGQGGTSSNGLAGLPGTDTTITGDAVTVHAHGGGGGKVAGSPGAAGTGSANTIHHNGGAGGDTDGTAGGAGGGSGGSAAAGNAGGAASSNNGGTGATAVAYGGPGGDGGDSTGGGGGTKNYTKSYNALHTYSYAGSDGTQANALLYTDGYVKQGGDVADTYNGKCKCWILFPSSIATDLSGATVTKVTLKLTNIHSWFNSGMTVAFGWDTTTSFPSTKADPSSHADLVDITVGEGATKTFTIDATGSSFGAAFQSSSARDIVLFKNSNSLTYYGYFTGGTNPVLTVYYKK